MRARILRTGWRARSARAAFVLPLMFALAALSPPPLRAAPPTYTGEAPVASQSDDDRGDALRKALAKVIVDVTGSANAPARSDVAAALAKADRYVLQYRYRANDATVMDPDAPKWVLVAEFDSAAVDAMLDRLGFGSAGTAAAVVADTPSEASVWISGIRSAGDYARAMGYLRRNNLVRRVEPAEARGDGMLVKLSLSTTLASFLDALALERRLTVVNAAPPVEGVDATLALAP